jgi:hypothetical protein
MKNNIPYKNDEDGDMHDDNDNESKMTKRMMTTMMMQTTKKNQQKELEVECTTRGRKKRLLVQHALFCK